MTMFELLTALFVCVGGLFILIGSIGLARLPNLFMRLHGPTKATTLGIGGILIASMLHFSSQGDGLSLHEILVTLFVFLTAPISAYLVGRAALHLEGSGETAAVERQRKGGSHGT
jgi:multicomponent K+:H+ antiporter subunit G